MILTAHIITALFSIAMTTHVFFRPSKVKLNFTYSLVTLTFLSGIYLAFTQPLNLKHTCLSGLVYLTFVFGLLFKARNKLIQVESNTLEC